MILTDEICGKCGEAYDIEALDQGLDRCIEGEVCCVHKSQTCFVNVVAQAEHEATLKAVGEWLDEVTAGGRWVLLPGDIEALKRGEMPE